MTRSEKASPRAMHFIAVLVPYVISNLICSMIRTAPVSRSYNVYESGKQPGSKAKSMLQVHYRHTCKVPMDLCNHTKNM